jgi:hypothetical protein
MKREGNTACSSSMARSRYRRRTRQERVHVCTYAHWPLQICRDETDSEGQRNHWIEAITRPIKELCFAHQQMGSSGCREFIHRLPVLIAKK